MLSFQLPGEPGKEFYIIHTGLLEVLHTKHQDCNRCCTEDLDLLCLRAQIHRCPFSLNMTFCIILVVVFSAITPGVSELVPCLQVSIGGRKVRTLGMGDYVGVNLRVLSAGFDADATDCFGDARQPLFNPEWGQWGCARFHHDIS